MKTIRIVLVALPLTFVMSATMAQAQTCPTAPGLLDQMCNLFVQDIVLARTPAGGGIVQHTPVFSDDPRLAETTSLINQVSQQIGSQLSLLPLGSSSGGFTYAYDSSLGTFSRTTQTFGPAFAERAATVGKGKASFGMNYVFAKYDSLDGKNLEAGDIKFNLFHQHLNPPSFVEGDVIQAALGMRLTSATTSFFVNYGVTDRLDVAVAVPIVHVSMELTYHATILDFATHVVAPATHTFADGSKTQDFSSNGSASGIGDVVLRGKYNLVGTGAQGVAVGVDVRLPSGDENNMLGSGSTQTAVYLIGSTVVGEKVSPHVNAGYSFAKGGIANDQANYVGGIEYGATPRVTVLGDLLGRTVRSAYRLSDASVLHSFQQGPTAPIETTTLQTISETSGSLTSLLAALGVKFNPWRNLLISAHVLVPVNDAGLKSRVIPALGFDYSF
jgi:hypothetical protein